jgi:hypothetical protein
MFYTPPFDDPMFLQRSLSGYAAAIGSLAVTFSGPSNVAAQGPAALQASLAEGYRRLFAAAAPAMGPRAGTPGEGASTPALVRFQVAVARWAELMSAIAQDAGARLAAALQQAGADEQPVTSLAALRALWVDCGEAAYAETARRDEFAAAQAELLMATVELSASA